MENASNALFIAAGVLISVLVLSLGMYLFTSFSAQSREVSKELANQELERFNVQFTSLVGQEETTIYDVVSIASLATENNVKYELPKPTTTLTGNDNYVCVQIKNTNIGYNNYTSIERGYGEATSRNNLEYYNNIILNSLNHDCEEGKLAKYDCEVEISEVTGRVYLVKFSRRY